MSLPITVIIPTLNCKKGLIQHLEQIQTWLPQVGQIIAIDSTSADGTWEVHQEKLAPLGSELISTGPGLYKAWNQAVCLANQPYVYFSTIGDIITLKGLQKLVGWAEESDLDVVISSPRIINEDGSDNYQVKWPIHFINPSPLREDGLHLPSREEKYMLANLFFPESIIGSSASNLYRTQLLKEAPFPENVGTEGDVIWAARNLIDSNVGISTDQLATFSWDGDRSKSYNYISNKLEQIERFLTNALIDDGASTSLSTDSIKCVYEYKYKTSRNLAKLERVYIAAYNDPLYSLKLKYKILCKKIEEKFWVAFRKFKKA